MNSASNASEVELRDATTLPNRSKTLKLFSVSGLWNKFRRWINDPLNIALLLWTITVAVTTGMLNLNISLAKSHKDGWVESCGQIFTALFTLVSLYRHPTRTYHLFLLKRWEPEDIALLRKVYSKNGSYSPNERFHMTVVVLAFHTNYFAQYALSALNVGYDKDQRPKALLGIAMFFVVAGGLVLRIYPKRSPLGKECNPDQDPELVEAEQTNVRIRVKKQA